MAWPSWLRPLWVRVGSDPYYASFDRAMHNIKEELDRIKARGGGGGGG